MKDFKLILLFLLFSLSAEAQVVLPVCEDFEGANNLSLQVDSNRLAGIINWDFQTNTASGRLRTSAGAGYYSSGSQGITLDANPSGTMTINYAVYNLLYIGNYAVLSYLIILYCYY